MRELMAMVLSGGAGERLSVLAAERAVSAIPFAGKYRIIDFVLSNCCHSEVDQVGILTQYAPTSLHDHIGAGRPWDLDHRDRGVMILQPYLSRTGSGWYRGTADAIAQNWDVIEERGCRRVLVLSGDHVYRMDYRALLETHVAQGAEATIAVTPVLDSEAHRFGIVTLDDRGRVKRLIEKPATAVHPLASMGVYLFEASALRERLRPDRIDLVADVLTPMISSGAHVHAHAFEGYWEDVGTIGSYYRANLDLLAYEPRLVLDDRSWRILTRDEERPPVQVQEGAEIEQSLVSNGCRVAGTVRRSVLSPGVVVGPGAVVEDSIVLQDVTIGAGARIERAILDKYARIGEHARIGGPGGSAAEAAHELVVVGKDARVPDGARVEPGVVVGLGAVPSDFAGERVATGTRIPNRTWYSEGV